MQSHDLASMVRAKLTEHKVAEHLEVKRQTVEKWVNEIRRWNNEKLAEFGLNEESLREMFRLW